MKIEKIMYESHKKDGADIDFYQVNFKRTLSTKEVSLWIDFKNKKVFGDINSAGSWYSITTVDEVKEVLEALKKSGKLKRDFSKFMKNIEK